MGGVERGRVTRCGVTLTTFDGPFVLFVYRWRWRRCSGRSSWNMKNCFSTAKLRVANDSAAVDVAFTAPLPQTSSLLPLLRWPMRHGYSLSSHYNVVTQTCCHGCVTVSFTEMEHSFCEAEMRPSHRCSDWPCIPLQLIVRVKACH